MKSQKVRWDSLARIGLVFGAALVGEARLPFSPGVDSWLLMLWVLMFYGVIALWISANREALENSPRPLDCVGRPIIDPDSVEPDEFVTTKDNTAYRPLSRPLSRSEAM